MTNVIVAFSKPEDGKSIRSILVKNGYQVPSVCTSGAQAIAAAESLGDGIVVSGYRFEDMLYLQLRQYLPDYIDMLLISSPSRLEGPLPEGVTFLPMPLKVGELLNALEKTIQNRERLRQRRKKGPRERNPEEIRLIGEAKALLMERKGMMEAQAHRYIQKCSMDNGSSLVENARMVIRLFGG